MYRDSSFHRGKKINYIVDIISKLPNNAKVLELGCGDGDNIITLKKAGLLKKIYLYSVDISEESLNIARQIDKNIFFVKGDVCRLNMFKDDFFDFVYSTQVIEHVESDEEMIKEIYRLLRGGGTCYIDTVLKEWYGWYFYRNSGKWVLHPEHVREYMNKDEFISRFLNNGFTINASGVSQIKYSFYEMLVRVVHRLKPLNGESAFPVFDLEIPIIGYKNLFFYGEK